MLLLLVLQKTLIARPAQIVQILRILLLVTKLLTILLALVLRKLRTSKIALTEMSHKAIVLKKAIALWTRSEVVEAYLLLTLTSVAHFNNN